VPRVSDYPAATTVTDDDVLVGNDGVVTKKIPASVMLAYVAAYAANRANHQGTQTADTLTDGTTVKAFTASERTKLSGVATAATANLTDAALLNRDNHTGAQLAATISDFAAAVAAVSVAPNVYTADHTLDLTDLGRPVEMSSTLPTVVTVPPNNTVAIPVGAATEVCRLGSGTVTVAPGAGVTILSEGSVRTVAAQYGSVVLRQRAANVWVLGGRLG
jgi:hypothetical protein